MNHSSTERCLGYNILNQICTYTRTHAHTSDLFIKMMSVLLVYVLLLFCTVIIVKFGVKTLLFTYINSYLYSILCKAINFVILQFTYQYYFVSNVIEYIKWNNSKMIR